VTQLEIQLGHVDARHPGKCLSFTLTLRNSSETRLVLPYPDITDLRFRSCTTGDVSEWYTDSFVSSEGAALVLEASTSRVFKLDARFQDVNVEMLPHEFSEFQRWCVDLPIGEYTAWYTFVVSDDYFDGDSHWRIGDLEREAAAHDAVVWKGQVFSNAITVVRRPT